jgi:hypothetical protein
LLGVVEVPQILRNPLRDTVEFNVIAHSTQGGVSACVKLWYSSFNATGKSMYSTIPWPTISASDGDGLPSCARQAFRKHSRQARQRGDGGGRHAEKGTKTDSFGPMSMSGE